MANSLGEIILYTTDNDVRVELHVVDGTVWLSQTEIARLFATSQQNVSQHIRNIIEDKELQEVGTHKEFLYVRKEGARNVQRSVIAYNLDMILAVGYRVRSPRAAQFRKWANTVLKEYLVKGFAMDDKRLKAANDYDYFDELLARIRDIRTSEKRFYQKVRDLFCTAVDYDKDTDEAKLFFKVVQNKMLWAVTGHTAAEIIAERSNPNKPNMGLTSWIGERVRKCDVTVSKNYLNEDEISKLNRIVTMYLDYAEHKALSRETMTMNDWANKLDAFLSFNDHDVLKHAGHVSMLVAEALAHERYDVFDTNRRKLECKNDDAKDMEIIVNIVNGVSETPQELNSRIKNPMDLKNIPLNQQTEQDIQAALDCCKSHPGIDPKDLMPYAHEKFSVMIEKYSGYWVHTTDGLVWRE